MALGLAAILAACGQAGTTPIRVSLLPDTAAKGKAWAWTASCQFAPAGPTGCDPSGPNLAAAQLEGDAWNLGGGRATAGAVGMGVSSSGAWTVKGDLPSAPPCTSSTCIASSANTWVRGYPSVLYGINQCNAGTSPAGSPKLSLPIAVSSIPADLVATTTYQSQTAQVTHDIAYDMWLSDSATKAPCRTNGTVEVMVWTDYDAKAVLPDGMKAGTTSIPFAVNGAVKPGDQAWSMYASNVFQGGRTQPWGGTVWLVLNKADTTGTGKVTVDLSTALAAVGKLLEDNYGWSNFQSHYWLDTIAFGMEFGPGSGDAYGTGPAHFSLNLSSYCLQVETTVAKAEC